MKNKNITKPEMDITYPDKVYPDKIYEAEIFAVNNLGNGICRIDSAVIFVPDTVDGDRIRLKIVESKPNYYIGKAIEIIEKSPHRITPDCELFASGTCGGCDFRHISYAHELEIKKSFVESAMRRNGFADMKINDVISSGESDGYRSKIIVHADKNGCGYYKKSTYEIAYQKRCMLHPTKLDEIIQRTQYLLRDVESLSEIYAREAGKSPETSDEIMLCIKTDSDGFRDECKFAETIMQEFPDINGVFANDRKLAGEDYIEDTLCGLRFRISPKSFYQVNRKGAEILYNLAVNAATENAKKIVDLYCGTGTIGMCIAKKSQNLIEVTGVEIIKSAVEDAEYNAKLNGVENIRFICGDAKEFSGKIDTAVIDPPRKGCSDEMISTLVRLSPDRIVYISCNPETMARDAKKLCQSRRYEVKYAAPVDMFPRTSHVECVILMSRIET